MFFVAEALREAEGGNKDMNRQLQELIIIRSELQSERDAMQAQLSDLGDANRDLQLRLEAANAALLQVKQDLENRLRDSEEEFENTRYYYYHYLLPKASLIPRARKQEIS